MKKLIIALVITMGLTGFAQETTKAPMKKMTWEQRQQKQLAHLTKELTLDLKQQEAVGKILSEKSAKAKEMHAQKQTRKASPDKITPEEKAAFKAQMQAKKADTEAKMKTILSADQYKKWETMREEKKEKMKERRKEKCNSK